MTVLVAFSVAADQWWHSLWYRDQVLNRQVLWWRHIRHSTSGRDETAAYHGRHPHRATTLDRWITCLLSLQRRRLVVQRFSLVHLVVFLLVNLAGRFLPREHVVWCDLRRTLTTVLLDARVGATRLEVRRRPRKLLSDEVVGVEAHELLVVTSRVNRL